MQENIIKWIYIIYMDILVKVCQFHLSMWFIRLFKIYWDFINYELYSWSSAIVEVHVKHGSITCDTWGFD